MNRTHLVVPVVDFKFESTVPVCTSQGQAVTLSAASIDARKDLSKATEISKNIPTPSVQYTNTVYMPEVEGIILEPYVEWVDANLSDLSAHSKGWTTIKDVKAGQNVYRYPLKYITADSGFFYISTSRYSDVNKSFSVVVRQFYAKESRQKAWFRIMFGEDPAFLLSYCEGRKFLDIYKTSSQEFPTLSSNATEIPGFVKIASLSLLAPGSSTKANTKFSGNVIVISVLFIGNNIIVGLGEPDDGFYSSAIVYEEVPAMDEFGNPISSRGEDTGESESGQSQRQIRKYPEGKYGVDIDASGDFPKVEPILQYFVGDIYFIADAAQTDIAFGDIKFKTEGSFEYGPIVFDTRLNFKKVYWHVPSGCDLDFSKTMLAQEILSTGQPGENGLYKITVNYTGNGEQTPVYYSISGSSSPIIQTINVRGLEEPIAASDILSVSGTEYPDHREYTVTMRNREGKWFALNGCYPVSLSFGWKYSNGSMVIEKHLTGYVKHISYERTKSTSTVTLTLIDRSVVCKDNPAMYLPIYDGWYDTDIIYDLAERCGISSSDVIINTTPKRVSRGDFKNVFWMFSMGTPIWDCMVKVAQYTRCWLYFDEEGKLHYENQANVIRQRRQRKKYFKEVTQVGDFREIKRLSYAKDFDTTYNTVLVIGVSPLWARTWKLMGAKIPESPAALEKLMRNTSREGYIPWFKPAVEMDPHKNTQKSINAYCADVWKTLSKPVCKVTWETWGQPDLKPLDVVVVQEEAPGGVQTVGADPDKAEFIIISISHSLDAKSKTYTTTITGERLIPGFSYSFNY